jgi:large subunit ribosomal protein L20
MAHAQSGANRARRKKILKMAKGYRGRSSTCIRIAREKVEKGLQYAYRDRRNKKRTFRALWIQRINAGAREHGMIYSQFMGGLIKAGIVIDRKILADLAISEPAAFKALVEQARNANEKSAADGKKAA